MYKSLFAVLCLAALLAACSPVSEVPPTAIPPATQAPEELEVIAVVEEFGARLKNVSLLAPDAAGQIETQYAGLASAELIAAWQADPTQAPGRLTSSPWPDRIDIKSVELVRTQGYRVFGFVVEATSDQQTDMVAGYPVELTLSQVDGNWLITEFQVVQQ